MGGDVVKYEFGTITPKLYIIWRQNEDATLNRMRRVMSEESQGVEALLRCRKQLLIGTLNVNTLRNENRAAELDQCRKAVDLEILGIQEHRQTQ